MPKKIEEAFNDCLERLTLGESYDSCIHSYPEYAGELDTMLRITYDVKKRSYPIQPRPEYKYWSRVRMQSIMNAPSMKEAPKSNISQLRRNLAISLSALLIFMLASGGTAAASADALPDQPLYGIKLAVERVEIALTTSDNNKAELYASLAEKRANEIAVMASQGKTEQVVTTTNHLFNYLDEAERLITKSSMPVETVTRTPWVTTPTTAGPPSTAPATTTASSNSTTSSTAAAASVAVSPTTSGATPGSGQTSNTSVIVAPVSISKTQSVSVENTSQTNNQRTAGSENQTPITLLQESAPTTKSRIAVNESAAKALTILRNAMEKAPESVKPSLAPVIERTKNTSERLNTSILQNGISENSSRTTPAREPKPIPNMIKTNTDNISTSDNKSSENTTDIWKPKPASENLSSPLTAPGHLSPKTNSDITSKTENTTRVSIPKPTFNITPSDNISSENGTTRSTVKTVLPIIDTTIK